MTNKGLVLITNSDGTLTLYYNGKAVHSFSGLSEKTGLYVNGSKLVFDGHGIGETEETNAVLARGADLYLNEVNLTESGQCINITLSDYNTLKSGGYVAGYECYDSNNIYNIVDDVSEADTITYTESNGTVTFSVDETTMTVDKHPDTIYNDAANSLDTNEVDDENTMFSRDANGKLVCPFVNVKWFNPIVKPGHSIKLTYYVDNRSMTSINNKTLQGTFTTIVRVNDEAVASGSSDTTKRTTYSGEFTIETPVFTLPSGVTELETRFSIECVDDNGVGSVVQWFDVLVRDSVIRNYYDMTEQDLADYGITTGECAQIYAYKNKAALTRFFAEVKDGGYNGVNLLPDRLFYLDYHMNVNYTIFKVAITNAGVVTVEAGHYYQPGATRVYREFTAADVTGDADSSIAAVQSQSRGTTKYYYYQDTENIQFGSVKYYKVVIKNLTLTNEDEKSPPDNEYSATVFSCTEGNFYNEIKAIKEAEYSNMKTKRFCTKKYTLVSSVPSVGATVTFKGYNAAQFTKSIGYVPPTGEGTSNILYYVVNTCEGSHNYNHRAFDDDFLKLPDSFTVNLNGSTIKAYPFNDIQGGWLLYMYKNFDTHIIGRDPNDPDAKRGKILGPYNGFDFVATCINLGLWNNAGESIFLERMHGCRYCSFEDLDMGETVGYGGCAEAADNTVNSGTYVFSTSSTNNTMTVYDGNQADSNNDKYIRQNSYIDLSDGSVVNTSEDESPVNMVVSGFLPCTVSSDHTRNLITFGSMYGYKGYPHTGVEKICFAVFYDSSKAFIGYTKTRMYYPVQLPDNVAYVRFCGYGEAYNSTTDKIYGFSAMFGMLRPVLSLNCSWVNCDRSNTRSTGLSIFEARHLLVKDCSFSNIAVEPYVADGGWGVINPYAISFEDGWQYANDIHFLNCTMGQTVGSKLRFCFCQHLSVIGTTGFSFQNEGGVEDGFIEDNVLNRVSVVLNRSCAHPHNIFRRNRINSLSVTYEMRGDLPYFNPNDVPARRIAMCDSVINEYCSYPDLVLHNSSMAGVGY